MLIPLAGILGLAGCQQEPEVRTQPAPRLDMTRCLGAIVFPRKDDSTTIWLFKVVGQELEVDRLKPAFEKFILHDLSFGEKEKATWKLPEGWKEHKINKQLIPKLTAGNLEIAVSQRTMRKPFKGAKGKGPHGAADRGESNPLYNVEQQINNWRREIGLFGLNREAAYFYEPFVLENGGWAFIVNMVGPEQKNVDTTEFVFDLPEGWVEMMPTTMSLLSIRIQEEDKDKKQDKKATFTLSQAGGNLQQNFDRWRDQVGLKKLGDLAKMDLSDIVIDGNKGKFADLIRPPAKDDEKKNPHKEMMGPPREDRILGGIIERRGQLWFFKLSGPVDLLEKQKRNYEAFLSSFAFTE